METTGYTEKERSQTRLAPKSLKELRPQSFQHWQAKQVTTLGFFHDQRGLQEKTNLMIIECLFSC